MKNIFFAIIAICFNLNALAQDNSTDKWVQHIGENGQIPDLPRQGPLLLQKNAISNEFINTFYNCVNNDCYIKPQFENNELDVLKLQQLGWWEEQERAELEKFKAFFNSGEYEKNKQVAECW